MHSHYSQKACHHTKFQFQFSMVWPLDEFKRSHNFMVMALGHSVKWPSTVVTKLVVQTLQAS